MLDVNTVYQSQGQSLNVYFYNKCALEEGKI